MPTYFERRGDKLKSRIKAIDENPSKFHLRANKWIYERELRNLMRLDEAWKAGKPFAIGHGIDALLVSMGFWSHGYIAWGDRVTWDPQRYLDAAVQRGYSEHSCDRTITALGLLLTGEIPAPKLVVSFRFACDPARMSVQAAAEECGAHFFGIDNAYGIHDDSLRFFADQLGELIEFCEKKIPGIKYDEDRLIEILHRYGRGGESGLDREGEGGRFDIAQQDYELRKRVPCPISPQDAFRLGGVSRQGLEELYKRAEKGIGGVPEEKLRVCWMATGPYGRAVFDLLMQKGVSIPWFHYGGSASIVGVVPFADESADIARYGRKLTPLEQVAKIAHFSMWAQAGDLWIDPLVKICKDLKIDAVVDYLQPGCVVTKGLRPIISQRLTDEVGIPVLHLEGRQWFNTPAGHAEMTRRLEEFFEFCIQNKQGG